MALTQLVHGAQTESQVEALVSSGMAGGSPGELLVFTADPTATAATPDGTLTVTAVGSITTAFGPFPDTTAPVFGGTERYTFATTYNLDPHEGAIEAWVYRASDPGGNQYLFSVGVKGSADWFGLRINATDKAGLIWQAGGISVESEIATATAVSVGSWHYLYADWLDGEMRVSLDNGTLATKSRDVVGAFIATNPSAVGAYNGGFAGGFTGRIYGVRISRRRLTDAERLARFAAQSPWAIDPTDTVATTRFDLGRVTPAQMGEFVIGGALGPQRVRPWYDAVGFGAIGDGITNDTAAIQAAHDAAFTAGGGVVFLPPGRFRIGSTLAWKSGVSLIGSGWGRSVLLYVHTGFPLIQNTTDYSAADPMTDVTFADFEIDASANLASAYSSSLKGIFILHMKRAVFRGLYVHDTPATGIGCDFLVDAWFDRCIIENCGRLNSGSQPGGAGIGIATGASEVENTVVSNCVVTGNKRFGIFFEQKATGGVFSRGARVLGCHAEGNGHGIVDAGMTGMLIANCSAVGNLLSGIAINRGTISPAAGHTGAVVDCDLHDNGAHGLHVDYGGDEDVGGYVVRGNRARGNTGDGIRIDLGDENVPNLWLSDNDCRSNTGYGIRMASTGGDLIDGIVERNRVTGNTAGTLDPAAVGLGTVVRDNIGYVG